MRVFARTIGAAMLLTPWALVLALVLRDHTPDWYGAAVVGFVIACVAAWLAVASWLLSR